MWWERKYFSGLGYSEGMKRMARTGDGAGKANGACEGRKEVKEKVGNQKRKEKW